MDTPYTIIKEIKASNAKQFEAKVRQIRGIYQNDSSASFWADDHFYDSLKDDSDGTLLKIRVPPQIKPQLKNGYLYELEGLLEQQIPKKATTVILRFKVLRILGETSFFNDKSQEARSEVLAERYSKNKKDVDEILKKLLESGKRPKIALVLGNNAYTDEDVYEAHKSFSSSYVSEEIGINIASAAEIIAKLKEIDNKTDNNKFDVIALFRGGETALDVFNDLDLAKTVLNLKTPFIMAVGHAVHHPFLEEIADKFFATPTALGNYLKEMADKAAGNIRQRNRFKEVEKEYKSKIDSLTRSLAENEISKMSFDSLKAQLKSIREEISQFPKILQNSVKENSSRSLGNETSNFAFGTIFGLMIGLALFYLYSQFIQPHTTKELNENNIQVSGNVSNMEFNANIQTAPNSKPSSTPKRAK